MAMMAGIITLLEYKRVNACFEIGGLTAGDHSLLRPWEGPSASHPKTYVLFSNPNPTLFLSHNEV